MVKVKKKARDEEGGKSENKKSDYVQWSGKKNENDLEEVVGDLN